MNSVSFGAARPMSQSPRFAGENRRRQERLEIHTVEPSREKVVAVLQALYGPEVDLSGLPRRDEWAQLRPEDVQAYLVRNYADLTPGAQRRLIEAALGEGDTVQFRRDTEQK